MKDKQELIDHMNKFMFERTYPEGVMLEILTELEKINALETLDQLPDKMPLWFDRFLGLKKDLWEELRNRYGIGKVNHTITIEAETHLVQLPENKPDWFHSAYTYNALWTRCKQTFGTPNFLWWHEKNLKGKKVLFKGEVEHELDGEIFLGISGSKFLHSLNVKEVALCVELSIEEKILAKLDDEGKAMFKKFIKEKGHE